MTLNLFLIGSLFCICLALLFMVSLINVEFNTQERQDSKLWYNFTFCVLFSIFGGILAFLGIN